MSKMLASLLTALFVMVASTLCALAQAPPNSPCIVNGNPLAFGVVPTAGQWNACFQAKQDALLYVPVNKSGDTMNGRLALTASTTFRAGLGITPGVAPSSPVNGDVWVTAAGIFVQINGATVQLSTGGATVAPGVANQVAIYTGTNAIGGVTTLPTGLTIPGAAQLISTGTSPPSSVAGQTVIMGTIAAPTLTNTGQAFLYNTVANGAVLQGDGSTNDFVLANKSGATVCNAATGTQTIACNTLTLTNALAIAQGGTGQTTKQSAFNALAPTPTRAGDLTYWNGSNYVNLAGNNVGTKVLQEDASGNPTWVSAGTGTVTSVGTGVGLTGGTITTTGTISRSYAEVAFTGVPANPTGTNSASFLMMGLGSTCKITPTQSGRVLFTILADVQEATAGVSASTQGQFGTGTAPVNGAAVSGSNFDGSRAETISTASGFGNITIQGYATGLALSTQVWFDAALQSNGSSIANILNIHCWAIEF